MVFKFAVQKGKTQPYWQIHSRKFSKSFIQRMTILKRSLKLLFAMTHDTHNFTKLVNCGDLRIL